MDKKWCVYLHTSPSSKYYVGITSQKPNNRWRNGNGYKQSPYFYNAIKKYGWDNIKHEIIANGLTEDEAKNYEKDMIAKLKSDNSKYGYNITAGGEGTVGVSHYGEENSFYGKRHSKETKEILSKTLKKKWESGILDEIICRPIYQFDLNGNLVNEYSNIREAERKTGIDHSVISRVCKGKLNYTHGFTWAYKDQCNDLEEFKRNFLLTLENKRKNYAKHIRKPVNLYDLTGNFLANFESASELARKFNVHKDTVAYSCRHNSIFQGRYKCQYV